MGGQGGSLAVLATGLLLGAVACSSGGAAVFHPAGSLPVPPARPAPLATPAGQRFGGFRFPADVSIEFTSPAPAAPFRRAIVAGYQDYVLSLWAGVLSHGKDTAYASQDAGDALTFVAREVAHYRWPGWTVRGSIRYWGTRVTAVYSGTAAGVISCVDASAFHAVNALTGATAGPALPGRPGRYLEEVSEGRRSHGTWQVNRSVIYPASSTRGAVCR
jgi:hypothetical protein